MAAYEYLALSSAGEKKTGSLEADSARQARQLLRDRKLAPIDVTRAADKDRSSGQLHWLSRSINAKNRAMITRQMATLVQAGLPLEEVIGAVAEQCEDGKIRSMLLAIRSKILEGHSLAQSLKAFPRAFPHLYRATVAAGEHSGHLDLVMNQLADYTENAQDFRQKVHMAMVYPVILLTLAIAIIWGLMVYVVPDVIAVFVDTGQGLPPLTAALVAFSDFIAGYSWLLLIVLFLVIIAVRGLLQLPKVRLLVDQWLLHLPFIRKFSRGFNTARYTSTLSILSSSGVALVDGMKIAGDVVSNKHLQQQLAMATQKVSEGTSLHKALTETGYFPPIMLHMIASGESSGKLDNMLERTAKQQEQDLQNLISLMVGLFEPFMLIFMGVTVLLIVLAILLPILSLNQLVG